MYRLLLTAAVVSFAAPPGAMAQGDPLAGVIAQLGYRTLDASVTMTVVRGGGEPMVKRIEVQTRDTSEGQDLFMQFVYPSNMKGTGFLALTKDDLDDEYYMYVRTLRRVKRVPNLSENFMLRDFMSLYFLKPRPELWDFTLLGADPENGALQVVQGTPKAGKAKGLAGYSRVKHWVDPSKRIMVRSEYYNSADKVIRVQRVLETMKIGGFFFPTVFDVVDYEEDVSAKIEVDSITFDGRISDDWFTVGHLKSL